MNTRERAFWCSRRVALGAAFLLIPSVAAVFLLGKRPAYVEVEWALAVVSCVLFLFFTAGLYAGIRLARPIEVVPVNTPATKKQKERRGSIFDALDFSSLADLFVLDEGCLVALAGILLALLALGGLLLLGYIFAQLGIDPFAVLAGGVGWVVYRGFRRVFLWGRHCAGKLGRSLLYAAAFTALYTGWGFMLIHTLRWIAKV